MQVLESEDRLAAAAAVWPLPKRLLSFRRASTIKTLRFGADLNISSAQLGKKNDQTLCSKRNSGLVCNSYQKLQIEIMKENTSKCFSVKKKKTRQSVLPLAGLAPNPEEPHFSLRRMVSPRSKALKAVVYCDVSSFHKMILKRTLFNGREREGSWKKVWHPNSSEAKATSDQFFLVTCKIKNWGFHTTLPNAGNLFRQHLRRMLFRTNARGKWVGHSALPLKSHSRVASVKGVQEQ